MRLRCSSPRRRQGQALIGKHQADGTFVSEHRHDDKLLGQAGVGRWADATQHAFAIIGVDRQAGRLAEHLLKQGAGGEFEQQLTGSGRRP